MMETSALLDFGDGIYVSDITIRKISDEFIAVLKKELPEEAQCSRVVDSVMEVVRSNLKCKRLIL